MAQAELAYSSFNVNCKIFKYATWKQNKIHSCEKPIELYKWILKNYAKPGQTIFDSHVGSGSIRIACHDMGFDFTGCELDPDYHAAQEKRYKEHVARGRELWEADEYQERIYEQYEQREL